MSISSRIHDTINEWSLEWGDKLRAWGAKVAMNGLEKTFDFFEPDLRAELAPSIERLLEIENLPDDIRSILEKAKTQPKAIQFAFLIPLAIGMLVGAGMGMASPVMRLGSYQVDKLVRSARFDPGAVITAWRRDKVKYEKLFDDLKDQGWSDDRIEALKFFTLYYPSPAELVHWTAREVFEPDKIAKYGLLADVDKLRREDFYKAGMDDTQIDNHWIAHWEHASWMQVIEMLHRHIITEQDVKDWFPLVEIAPYWAENLIKVAYAWPTRVDVRRFWDMGTIDEPRLKELYEGMGYHGKDLDDYVLWTKIYVEFPDLIARFKNGWITEDNVRARLAELGMPDARINEVMQTKVKTETPARTTAEKDLTKAEIVKGVKKGVISDVTGSELLQDMGYSENEAWFILEINIAAAAGSPETYPEFKKITQLYRKAQGMIAEIPPQDVIEAGKAMKDAEIALRSAESQNLTDAELAPYLKTLSDAEYRYRALLVKWEASKKKSL